MVIPITPGTFHKDFLEGAGSIDLSAGAFDLAKEFDPSVSRVGVAGGGVNTKLEFGKAGSLSCSVDFSAQAEAGVEIIWPGQPNDFTKAHNIDSIPAEKIGARFFANGSAGAKAKGALPLGPANFNFGVEANGNVFYDRFAIYDRHTLAQTLLTDLVTGLRLPEHCDTIDKIPAEGEVLCFSYDGFLKMTAGLSWGYELSGSHDVGFNDLTAAVEYQLRLKAAVSAGYTLGGRFSIDARQGHLPNWVRVCVRKAKDRQVDFAASFNADAAIKLTGLPDSADEFLKALLGTDAKAALDLFDKIKDYTDIKKLEADAGKLLNGTMQSLSQKWLGKSLDSTSLQDFLKIVQRVVAVYKSADQLAIAKIIHLYEDYRGRDEIDALKNILGKIAGLSGKDGLKTLGEDEVWSVLMQLAGGDLPSVLTENKAFAEVTSIAKQGLDLLNGNELKPLREAIDQLKKTFRLDKIFGALEKIDTKEELLRLADEELQGVVEKLLGKLWPEIEKSIGTSFADLHSVLQKVDEFKQHWYQRLTEAANQQFNLQVNYAYTRATHGETLLDVEIDLTAPGADRLFTEAVHGDFQNLLKDLRNPAVIVRQGKLTHAITKSTHLQIAVLGWKFSSLRQVLSSTVNALETGPTGQILVFATQVSIDQRNVKKGRDKSTESLHSNFLLKFVGEAAAPTADHAFLAKTINSMAARYNLDYSDSSTTPADLEAYLELAEQTGLLPSAKGFVSELTNQFPNGLGKVNAQYVVAYDSDGVRDAFTAPRGSGASLSKAITPALVRAQLIKRGQCDNPALIALGYLEPVVRSTYFDKGYAAVLSGHWTVEVPTQLGGGTEKLDDKSLFLVCALLSMETSFGKKLDEIDELVAKAKLGTPIKQKDLEEAARDFVEKAADIQGYGRLNSFFVVFDALVRVGSNGKGYRETTLILTIEALGTGKVTKFLSAGPA